MLTRRQLMKSGAAATAAIGLTWDTRRAYPFAQSPTGIRKFVTTCRVWGRAVSRWPPNPQRALQGLTTDVYKLGVAQFAQQMHPDFPRADAFLGILRSGDRQPQISGRRYCGQAGHAGSAQCHQPAAQHRL